MKAFTTEDLESMLIFAEQMPCTNLPIYRRPRREMVIHLRAIQRQVDHMKLFSQQSAGPEDFLTKPNGLILIERNGDMDFYNWKFPNYKAGTAEEEFVLKDNQIQYDKEKYLRALDARNPSADIPQVLSTLEEARKRRGIKDSELVMMAYDNGAYLDEEIESLLHKTMIAKRILFIDSYLSGIVRKNYSMDPDGKEARITMGCLESEGIIPKMIENNDSEGIERIKTQLALIRDKDPRLEMQNYAKILINDIRARERKIY